MNIAENRACIGAENSPRDNKNNAEQQNITGVIIKTLYGLSLTQTLLGGWVGGGKDNYLSNFGSRTLSTTTPSTVSYVNHVWKVHTKYQLHPTTPINMTN